MPIYAYECTKCGSEEEHIQKFSDPPIKKCASCGGKLQRQVTSAAFHLKGGGWYKDGYASTKAAGSSDSGSATSDAKPAASGDKKSKASKKKK